jgi:hypothetical protein
MIELTDKETPRTIRQGLDKSKRKGNKGRVLPELINVQARFIYEGELRGEWFPLSAVFAWQQGLPITPNPEFKVIRLEFVDRTNI